MDESLDIRAFVDQLKTSRFRDRLVHVTHLPARPPRYGDLAPPLPARLDDLLRRQGIERLYTRTSSGPCGASWATTCPR